MTTQAFTQQQGLDLVLSLEDRERDFPGDQDESRAFGLQDRIRLRHRGLGAPQLLKARLELSQKHLALVGEGRRAQPAVAFALQVRAFLRKQLLNPLTEFQMRAKGYDALVHDAGAATALPGSFGGLVDSTVG